MLTQIKGLHHTTSDGCRRPGEQRISSTKLLGLRRVKKTVNFDAPDVYHLYYGDEVGTPGSVNDLFPLPAHREGPPRHRRGIPETAFAVPEGSLEFWRERPRNCRRRGAQRTSSNSAKSVFAFSVPTVNGFAAGRA